MELKCPICKKSITVDAGSETFYCKQCNSSYSTARCYHQQCSADDKFLVLKGTLFSYRGDEKEVVIPSNVNRINAGCFADNQLIEKVEIPSAVISIEAHAFANCRNLISVKLPDELAYIGLGCFADCVKLKKIRVPKGTKIGCSAFLRCSDLKASIYSKSSIKSVSFIGLSADQVEFRTTSDSDCYITSAVCEYRGEADDCEMLTRFRAFRDKWLINQPGGKEDIEEYYHTAPMIVKAIHEKSCCESILEDIYKTYLKPCFDLLNQGDYETCRKVYTNMVHACEIKYLQD